MAQFLGKKSPTNARGSPGANQNRRGSPGATAANKRGSPTANKRGSPGANKQKAAQKQPLKQKVDKKVEAKKMDATEKHNSQVQSDN